MPFKKVTAFDGKKGYIDSIDEGSSMTVVELDGKSYLAPDETLMPDNDGKNSEVYRIVRESADSGTALATTVKKPEVISRLVQKYFDDISISEDVIVAACVAAGRESYTIKRDDDPALKAVIAGIVKGYSKGSEFRTKIGQMLAQVSPGEVKHLGLSAVSYLQGMAFAASDAGHTENADYILDQVLDLHFNES